MPRSHQDAYARLLSFYGNGYPLWIPEPSHEFLAERPDGLRIGDVGVVLDNGAFDVFFNICLPPDHPFHRRHGVPEGFTYIDQSRLEISTYPNAANPGCIISSSSVEKESGTAEPSSSSSARDESSALTYRFNLYSSEGALLILPKGAEQIDLLNDGLFKEQASRHGAEWYNYAINRRQRNNISLESLYLITGIHKTLSWSVAAFANATGDERYTAHFKQIERDHSAPTYSWEASCALDWRVGPYRDPDVPNQAVFIRGFKIALRRGLLGTRWISVEADVPSTRSNPTKWTSAVPSSSWMPDWSALFSGDRGDGVSQTTMHNEGTSGSSEEPSQSDVPAHGGYDGMHVEIQRIPDVPRAFHPSDAINQYLLRKESSADIAITHDSLWISMLEDGLLTPEELVQESRLETVLSLNYQIVSHQGALHLEKKSDPNKLDDNELHATAETDPEEADKQSPPTNKSKMDADLQNKRNIASRIVSLVLEKMGQDVGSGAIGFILHCMVKNENASLTSLTALSPLVLRGHEGGIKFVAFLPDGHRILSASEDKSVRFWSVPDGDQKVIAGVRAFAIAVSPDGQRVATEDTHGTVRVWDTSMSEEISQSHLDRFSVHSLSFSPDSSRIACGEQDGSVSVWCTTTGKRLAGPFSGHVFCVCGICYAPDGRRIASCDKVTVRIWKDDSVIESTITMRAWSLAWLPDNDGLLVGCEDGTIKYIDSSAGTSLATLVGHSDAVLSIALSRSGKFFASASRDGTIRLWERAEGRYQARGIVPHGSAVHSVAISLDDRQLVSGGWDSCIHVWELREIAPSLFEDVPQVTRESLQPTDTRPPLISNDKVVTSRPSSVSTSRSVPSPRKDKIERERETTEAFLKQQELEKIRIEEHAAVSSDPMKGLLAMTASTDNEIHNDIPPTSEQILESVAQEPADAAATAAAFSVHGAGDAGPPHTALSPRTNDTFRGSFDFTTFEDEDDDYQPWSDTDSGPEGSKPKFKEQGYRSDPLRLGSLRNTKEDHSARYRMVPRLRAINIASTRVDRDSNKKSVRGSGNDESHQIRLRQLISKPGDKTTTKYERPTVAWNIYGIPPDLPLDLTKRIIHGELYPSSLGRPGVLYQGTIKASPRPIRVTLPLDLHIQLTHPSVQVGFKVITNQKRLRRSINSLLKLDHNNVAPFLGIIQVADRSALVFPWGEDRTLATYLKHWNDNLTTPSRLALINDVAMGLQYLHSQSVIHGNLSSTSVLIRNNGRACIADSGLWSFMVELSGQSITEVYVVNGTLSWAAPELVPPNKGDISTVRPTPESDMYAFGWIMWQVLTGRPPHLFPSRHPRLLLSRSRSYLLDHRSSILFTEDQRTFLRRCLSAVDSGQSRPSATETVEFVKEQLIALVISMQEDEKEINDVAALESVADGLGKCVCGWNKNGRPCNSRLLIKEVEEHFSTVHPVDRPICLWGDCGEGVARDDLSAHILEKHL